MAGRRSYWRCRDVLGRVIQPAVANQKIQAARGQIFPMNSGQAVGGKGSAHGIEFSVPSSSLDRYAAAGEPVDRRERETLCSAVIPSQAGKDAGLRADRLVKTDPGTIFERAGAIRRRSPARASILISRCSQTGFCI